MQDNGDPNAAEALELTILFCMNARRKVKRLFHELWHNDDNMKCRTALGILEDKFAWLESGIVTMDEAEKVSLKQ